MFSMILTAVIVVVGITAVLVGLVWLFIVHSLTSQEARKRAE